MDITITYETLFDILRKESSLTDLQLLDSDFWEQVVHYITETEKDLAQKKGRIEAEKIIMLLNNVKRILKDIYEKREKKIINLALNVVKTESISFIDTKNILPEEKSLFDDLVVILKSYKKCILLNVSSGLNPDTSCLTQFKGEIFNTITNIGKIEPKINEINKDLLKNHFEEQKQKMELTQNLDDDDYLDEDEDSKAEINEDGEEVLKGDVPKDKRIDVKFLKAVPKFLGQNRDVFGPFKEGDSASLPEKIAQILVKKGKVEFE
jgi:DNA replication initiation complex subunit (GINS family)